MPLNIDYKKFTHEEHVLKLPDTYIGSTSSNTEQLWIIEDGKMLIKEVSYVPGEFKLFDELIVNSLDQYTRIKESSDPHLTPVKHIKITTNKETGEISVYNDGEGIKIEMNEDGKYIPELIFGDLLTSSNYNFDELKHVGGKNGYGAKLTNIFSSKFTIETVDNHSRKKFTMTFYDNKTRKDKPSIKLYKSKPYTKITYTPDYKRFGSQGLTDAMNSLMMKRAYDLAACTDASVQVHFNDIKLNCRTFESYINFYIGDKKDVYRVYERYSDRWEICAMLSPTLSFEQISFVNGINTFKGGKHVDYIVNQITKQLAVYINKKKKLSIKPTFIKENLMVFIKCTIDNPSFNSQSKEYLTTNKDKFGSKCEVSSKFIEALSKCGIIEKAMELSALKDAKTMKKTDGKLVTRLKGIPKLEDANWAGSKTKGHLCTLILTEGDSAKSLAMAGLSIIGRDAYGVFPLKGKLLNVRDIKNTSKIVDNVELNTLRKIMGLQSGKVYTKDNIKELRYGKIMILADQDEDGSHIKGLLFNLFDTLWASLFKMDTVFNSMLTPIVKVTYSNSKLKPLEFYSLKDFEAWEQKQKENDSKHKWTAKYYKGLGTSTPKEAKEYFKNMKMVTYTVTEPEDTSDLSLAFSKNDDSSDKRKMWLKSYDKSATLDYTKPNVSLSDFVHKDLKHFSNSDNIRSIPSVVDGLKPSQRKVLFGCLKRHLTKTEIKVAQLAGYISEHAAYHHGEASLQGTIVNMAQNYVGSNNIELLEPVGQFGTRLQGGKDSAQPRYIYTKLSSIMTSLFNKHDSHVLLSQTEEGVVIEPEYYVPILPMVLINGCQGIGTGWSTEVPCHNPVDIIRNIKRYLGNESMNELIPYYRGFKGTIEKEGHSYISKGCFEVKNNKLIITELPVGCWTDKYKDFLESITIDSKHKSSKQLIRYYNSHCTDESVLFELYVDESKIDLRNKALVEKKFKLTTTLSTSNMVLYDNKGTIQKYKSSLDILSTFCEVRLHYYDLRKEWLKGNLEKIIDLLKIKIQFIYAFIDGSISIIKTSKSAIIQQLIDKDYPKIDNSYDYLLKMPIYNLSEEKIAEFELALHTYNEELTVLLSKSIKELWLDDLNNLEPFLESMNYQVHSKKKKLKIVK